MNPAQVSMIRHEVPMGSPLNSNSNSQCQCQCQCQCQSQSQSQCNSNPTTGTRESTGTRAYVGKSRLARVGSRVRAGAILLLLATLDITGAAASSVVPMNLEQLARRADCIIEADVLGLSSRWNASSTQIVTDINLDVSQVLAGDCNAGRRSLTTLGGRVGDLDMRISGAPVFQRDQRVFLFLSEDSELWVPVLGMAQGLLTRELRPDGTEVFGNSSIGFFRRNELQQAVAGAREED